MGQPTRRSAVRAANRLLARTLADLERASAADLAEARQAARDLLARSMQMGHGQLSWRRLEAALRLGLDMDEEMQRYFARLPRPVRGPANPLQGPP